MHITLAEFIAGIMEAFEREFGDRELAALAAQMILAETALGRPARAAPRRLLGSSTPALGSAA